MNVPTYITCLSFIYYPVLLLLSVSQQPKLNPIAATTQVIPVITVPPIHGPIAKFLKSCLFLNSTIQPLSPKPGTSPEHQQLSYSPINSIGELAISQRAFREARSLPVRRRMTAVALLKWYAKFRRIDVFDWLWWARWCWSITSCEESIEISRQNQARVPIAP